MDMSNNVNYLHSHSGLERTLKDKDIAKKAYVLVDEKFKDKFDDIIDQLKPLEANGKRYLKVPTLAFYHKGGVFKNLDV